jgi:hypothetical protein
LSPRLFIIVLAALPLAAQTSSLQGLITDAQAAAVPEAEEDADAGLPSAGSVDASVGCCARAVIADNARPAMVAAIKLRMNHAGQTFFDPPFIRSPLGRPK